MAKSNTQAGLFIPFDLTTATQVRLILADSAVGAATVTATINAGTYYSDLDADGAALGDNVLYEIARALNAQETADGTDGVTTVTVQSGNYTPKYTLSRAQGDASDDVTSFEIIGGELSLEDLGFASGANAPDTGTAAADPATWTATKRPIGAWAISPPSANRGRFVHAPERQGSILALDSTHATNTLEVYGEITEKTVMFFNVPAAGVFAQYTGASDFTDQIGAAAGDERAALETWIKRLRSLGAVNVRLFEDLTDLSTYSTLRPSKALPWLSSLKASAPMEGQGNALAFSPVLSFFKVS